VDIIAQSWAHCFRCAAGSAAKISTGDNGPAAIATVNCPAGINAEQFGLDSSVYVSEYSGSRGEISSFEWRHLRVDGSSGDPLFRLFLMRSCALALTRCSALSISLSAPIDMEWDNVEHFSRVFGWWACVSHGTNQSDAECHLHSRRFSHNERKPNISGEERSLVRQRVSCAPPYAPT
jgi:hypothetical protein